MEVNCFDDGYFGFIGRPNVTAVYSPTKQEQQFTENGLSHSEIYCKTEEDKILSGDGTTDMNKSGTRDVTVLSGILNDQQSLTFASPEKYQAFGRDDVHVIGGTTQQFVTQQQPQQPYESQPQTFIVQQQYVTEQPYGNGQVNFTTTAATTNQFQTVQFTSQPQQHLTTTQQVTSQQYVVSQQQQQPFTNGITTQNPQQIPNGQTHTTGNFQSLPNLNQAAQQQGYIIATAAPPQQGIEQQQNSAYILQSNKTETIPAQIKFEIQTCKTVGDVQQQQPDIHYMSNSDGEDNSRCSFGSVPDGLSTAEASSDLPNYRCDICGSEFLTQVLLSSHKQKVHGRKDTMKTQKYCMECGASFTTKQQLEKHMLAVHKPADSSDDIPQTKSATTITCPICGKEYSKHYYRSHMDYHAGKRYTCELCGIEFPYRRKLQRHKKFHENTNDYKCPIKGCDMSFNSEISLKKHTKIHNTS